MKTFVEHDTIYGHETVVGLLTRRDLIKIWQGQKEEMLDSYTCPVCRNLLKEDESGKLHCFCREVVYYTIDSKRNCDNCKRDHLSEECSDCNRDNNYQYFICI